MTQSRSKSPCNNGFLEVKSFSKTPKGWRHFELAPEGEEQSGESDGLRFPREIYDD